MASPMQWTWTWANFERRRGTGRSGYSPRGRKESDTAGRMNDNNNSSLQYSKACSLTSFWGMCFLTIFLKFHHPSPPFPVFPSLCRLLSNKNAFDVLILLFSVPLTFQNVNAEISLCAAHCPLPQHPGHFLGRWRVLSKYSSNEWTDAKYSTATVSTSKAELTSGCPPLLTGSELLS